MEQDFLAEVLTPDYDYYDDGHELDPDHGDLEVMPEIGDNYLSAEVLIPHRETIIKRRVNSWRRDANGNPIGLANANPILDTRKYVVKFDNGDETTVIMNLNAEAMYVQCDPNGNQYILLDSLIDHRHLDLAIQPTNQKVVRRNRRTYMQRNNIGGSHAANRKAAQPPGRTFLTLKNIIL
jgi:hypothetical protein